VIFVDISNKIVSFQQSTNTYLLILDLSSLLIIATIIVIILVKNSKKKEKLKK
jgi:energy-converting hydrogenase Eha subunit H